MVSLLKLAKITEEGVRFLSPHDGSPMYVLPSQCLEQVISCRAQATHTGALNVFTELYWLRYYDAA
jgi:hypothetical protein